MLDELFMEVDDSFDKSVGVFQKELSRLRTGRANLSILDGVRVEYYGSPMPLSQVASCNVADARTITIKPWEKSLIGDIEKAILATDIGITPNSDGIQIRLPIPALTVERRKDLVKQVKKLAENARVTIRNARRDFKARIDEAEVPEDDQHRALKKLKDVTDAYIAKIDKISDDKEKEVTEQ